MNLKKHIRLKNSNNRERQLTEEEQALYNSLIAQVESNSASGATVKKKQNLWRILTPILSVAGAIAITLTCVFTLRNSGEFVYNDRNIKNETISFIDMQTNINFFDISFIEQSADQIFLYYDTKSNDKLYYAASANIELSRLSLTIVINEKYDYKFNIDGEVVTKQLPDYSITYNGISSRGQPTTTYKGWIKVQTETVYFNYVQTPDAGEDAFLESIQQIVKVKK